METLKRHKLNVCAHVWRTPAQQGARWCGTNGIEDVTSIREVLVEEIMLETIIVGFFRIAKVITLVLLASILHIYHTSGIAQLLFKHEAFFVVNHY